MTVRTTFIGIRTGFSVFALFVAGCGAISSPSDLSDKLTGRRKESRSTKDRHSLAQSLDAVDATPACGANLTDTTRVVHVPVSANLGTFSSFRSTATADNGAVITWLEVVSPQIKRVHVSRVNASGGVVWDKVVLQDPENANNPDKPSTIEIHGITSSIDGFATLARDSGGGSHIFLLSQDGEPVWQKQVEGGCDLGTTEGCVATAAMGGEGAIEWLPDMQQYAIYYAVGKNFGPEKGVHQGDNLRFVSRDGSLMEGGSQWGCSHSFNQQLTYNGSFVAAACYLHGSGAGLKVRTFDKQRKHRSSYVLIPADPNDYYHTHMGNLLPVADGFWWPVATKIRKDLLNQTGWVQSPESTLPTADIAIAHITINPEGRMEPAERVWITDTPTVQEDNVHLMKFEGGFLLVWDAPRAKTPEEAASNASRWEAKNTTYAQRINADGSPIGSPYVIPAKIFQYAAHGQRQNFFTYSNGDIGWAFGDQVLDVTQKLKDPTGRIWTQNFGVYQQLKMARIPSCQPAENRAPIVAQLPVQNLREGFNLELQVMAEDPDRDALIFSLKDAPEGMSVDASLGRIVWTVPYQRGAQETANHVVKVVVTDSERLTSEIDVTIAVVDDHPYLNSTNALDVNNDGIVSPLDSMILINALNLNGPRELLLPAAETVTSFIDVNGDDALTAEDVLRVVNALNE
jgi:hypothetical protein